jgi:MYXO-CTERM domain-containing protein
VKKHLLSILIFVATLGAWGAAAAAPIVIFGSTYTIYIAGVESGVPINGRSIFDNAPEFSERAGLILTSSEREQALGSGQSSITLTLSANGDLFPSASETGLLAIGFNGDGLDLQTLVALNEASINFYNASGTLLLSSGNLVGDVTNTNPWDGFFPDSSSVFGIDSVGGIGVTTITFDFLVTELASEVPEPGTAFLGVIGLAGAFAARRRPRKIAVST